MRKTIDGIPQSAQFSASDRASFRVGRIVGMTTEQHPLVDFPENLLGPLEARCTVGALGPVSNATGPDLSVLLAFDGGDPTLPIIIGCLRETVKHSQPVLVETLPGRKGFKEGIVDGRTVVFDAKEEIALRCGESSVVLRKDGKIIIRGTDIVTRASRSNKIKGAAVMIN